MPGTAVIIGALFGVAILVSVALAAAVWLSTRRGGPVDPQRMARNERTWLLIVVAILLAILFGTIFSTPYGNAGPAPQTMNVTAQQFAWTFDPPKVRAGEAVTFRLTSKDVNHGFGVYDSKHRLVFQVQVMPGRVQEYRHTFDEPGRYVVLCLEFCGVDHAVMTGGFEVTR